MPPANTVIIGDEALATFRLGLTGSIGILLKAKEMGYITAVKPLLTRLEQGGIHLSLALIEQALQQAGET